MRLLKPLLLTLLLTTVWIYPFNSVCAEEENVTELTAKPEYVSMFKNGVGLVISQVELPQQSGKFRVKPLPEATLGSFWMHWPENMTLNNIKATQVQSPKEVAAQNVQELLEANIGSTLDVKIQNDWQRARIISIPHRHDNPVIQPMMENIVPPPTPPQRGDLLILEDQMGKRAIPINWVQEIRFTEEDAQINIQRYTKENVIEFNAEFSNQSASREVSYTYLAKGITWSPSYVVDISEEDKADIYAKAVIVNDLIPLDNTDVELITGFPHIEFSNVNSMFSLAPLQQALESLRGGRRQHEAPVMSQRAIISNVAASFEPSMPDTPVMGESTEDLYFYQVNNVTLKKGERGYYPLFSEKIPYEHVYTWEIPNYIDERNRYRNEQSERQQEVWHSLKLTNTTQYPWTTAPAATTKDLRILGQDTIYYTPPKASSELKITQAVSVKAEENEKEIERKRNVATFYRDSYDLVKVKGEIYFKGTPLSRFTIHPYQASAFLYNAIHKR